jgi:hypothetical protein
MSVELVLKKNMLPTPSSLKAKWSRFEDQLNQTDQRRGFLAREGGEGEQGSCKTT